VFVYGVSAGFVGRLKIDAAPGYGCGGFQSIRLRRFMRRWFLIRVRQVAATRFMIRMMAQSS
jgi:hypothetical protein